MAARLIRMLPFIALAVGIVGGLHYYIWARLVRDTALPPPWACIGKWLIIALLLSLPLSFYLSRAVVPRLARIILSPIFVWMGLLFLLVVLLVASDLIMLVWIAASQRGLSDPADPERRLFVRRLLSGGAAGLAGILGADAIRSALSRIEVREVTVELPILPDTLDGTTIVQLTDLHLGPTLGRAFMEKVIAEVNALEPDLVVITGDLVDGTVQKLRNAVAPLAQLKVRHGAFFVTGNHEYYVSADGFSGAAAWEEELNRLGVRSLRNELVSIGDGSASFDLAGVDDYSARSYGGGPDFVRALAGRDPTRALVLLAHQPKAVFAAARLGVSLQLSGHTHGGQIWPFGLVVRLQQPYIAGLHLHQGTWLYVSRGTGFWGPPMRLFNPAEITRITLRSGVA